jgi:hypothetical protein
MAVDSLPYRTSDKSAYWASVGERVDAGFRILRVMGEKNPDETAADRAEGYADGKMIPFGLFQPDLADAITRKPERPTPAIHDQSILGCFDEAAILSS